MSDPSDDDDDLADVIDALDRGDQLLATSLALGAMQRGLEHPIVLLLVAEQHERNGSLQDAFALSRKATVLAPEEPELWRRLGGMLARHGMLTDALQAYNSALAIDPDAYATLIAAGAVCANLGNLRAANDLYRRAAKLAPDDAELLSTLAVIASYLHEFAEARALAAHALGLRQDSVGAQMAIARADLREGRADLAEARMTALLRRTDLNEESRINAFDLRAEALDAVGSPASAFADYRTRNLLLQRHTAPLVKGMLTERRVDQARRLVAHFAACRKEPWRARAGNDAEGARVARGHVFILGFPRSGTTLLEKVLASHSDVVTLEEVDHLAASSGHFLRDDSALAQLASLSTAEANARRRSYWSGVRKTLSADVSDKIVVDKLPLHTPALPAIAKLFPDAKVLFALRDPRDVVLSCFRRRFQVNSAMYEFLTLEGAAQYYDRIMALAEIYRAVLPLNVYEVRHEAMVGDFEAEVRKLLAFIGLDWDPAVRGFADRARSDPRTPSDPQVARGLNADGVDQWRRYEPQLAPVFGVLEPWVTRFGYPATAAKRP